MQEVLPPQTQEGAGFEPPVVRQFTVFMENKVGRLQQLVRSFEERGGRFIGLSVQDAADAALIRVICSDSDMAREAFRTEKLAFAEQDLLAVELPRGNKHPLSSICAALLAAEINILYAYPLLTRPSAPALAVCVDDIVLAAQLLIRKQYTLLGESDLRK